MRGETIDDMITDSALFLSEARAFGAETISIGDGGNEMGMALTAMRSRPMFPAES